jgi:DNA-binding MarR family transcriptional regulator
MSAMCCTVEPCGDSDCLQLTEREARVCEVICASGEPVAFSTLRTRLGYHQEVVSRILRRLVSHGAIEKAKGKYRRVSQ